MSMFAYPLSGGFRSWTLLPRPLVRPLLAVERALGLALGRLMGLRFMGVVEKT